MVYILASSELVPDEALSMGRVAIAALLAALAMSSVVIGAWCGFTFKASKKLTANILAFGSGALVNALAVDLAYGTTQHLVNEKIGNFAAWGIVAGGFFVGGITYFLVNRAVANFGGAVRHRTTARAHALELKREEASSLMDRLSNNALIRSLPPTEIDGLLRYLRDFKLPAGQKLFRQGDPGDAMYLIEKGVLGVFVEGNSPEAEPLKRIAEIKEGEIVGEMSLLSGAGRNATVTAEAEVEGLRIEKEDFDHLLEDSVQMKAAVKALAELRTLDNIKQKAGSMDSEAWAKMASQSIRSLSEGELEKSLAEHGTGNPLAIWIGNMMDAIPGSLVIGATFLGFGKFNPTLLISVFLANLPEAMGSVGTMQQAGYSKKKIYGLWWSIVLVGGLFAALGNFFLPTAPVALLGVCEAIAGGAILALVAQVMMPHAYEEGGDVVSVSTIAGFTIAFLLTALDMKELVH